jgi:hypothetical protein
MGASAIIALCAEGVFGARQKLDGLIQTGPLPGLTIPRAAPISLLCVTLTMGQSEMTIQAYLPTSGAIFGPEAVANMGEALEGAVDALGIEPRDETKREAVARFIIKLAEIDGGLDATSLLDKAVMALGGSIHRASLSKDGQPDADR